MQEIVTSELNCKLEFETDLEPVNVILVAGGKKISININPDNDYVLIHNSTSDFNDITLSDIEGINLEFRSGMLITTKQ